MNTEKKLKSHETTSVPSDKSWPPLSQNPDFAKNFVLMNVCSTAFEGIIKRRAVFGSYDQEMQKKSHCWKVQKTFLRKVIARFKNYGQKHALHAYFLTNRPRSWATARDTCSNRVTWKSATFCSSLVSSTTAAGTAEPCSFELSGGGKVLVRSCRALRNDLSQKKRSVPKCWESWLKGVCGNTK